ncbi:hypothetical protein FQN57_004122 [Myotisia sp. PD_48]|nr:hypothetical protein FQN57_004122 [Myotisia sp. PD_48]
MSSSNPSSPAKHPLSTRPTNTHLKSFNSTTRPNVTGDLGTDLKAATTKCMEYHREVLKEKLENGTMQPSGHYISPSDGIMSPCTQKLSNLKGKKFKNAKPQVLFAKALGKKAYEEKMNADNAVTADQAQDEPLQDKPDSKES